MKTTGAKQNGDVSPGGGNLLFSFLILFIFSAVNEQRRRLERNKMTTCQHEEETYYFPCNNPIPGIAKQFIFLSNNIIAYSVPRQKLNMKT